MTNKEHFSNGLLARLPTRAVQSITATSTLHDAAGESLMPYGEQLIAFVDLQATVAHTASGSSLLGISAVEDAFPCEDSCISFVACAFVQTPKNFLSTDRMCACPDGLKQLAVRPNIWFYYWESLLSGSSTNQHRVARLYASVTVYSCWNSTLPLCLGKAYDYDCVVWFVDVNVAKFIVTSHRKVTAI